MSVDPIYLSAVAKFPNLTHLDCTTGEPKDFTATYKGKQIPFSKLPKALQTLLSEITAKELEKRPLPDDIDPELHFISSYERCFGGKDYLFDSQWHTHPGRMAAYCPHSTLYPDYRISKDELPEQLPAATRYWVQGFLAGNLPTPPDEDDEPELFAKWQQAAKQFNKTGNFPYLEPDELES